MSVSTPDNRGYGTLVFERLASRLTLRWLLNALSTYVSAVAVAAALVFIVAVAMAYPFVILLVALVAGLLLIAGAFLLFWKFAYVGVDSVPFLLMQPIATLSMTLGVLLLAAAVFCAFEGDFQILQMVWAVIAAPLGLIMGYYFRGPGEKSVGQESRRRSNKITVFSLKHGLSTLPLQDGSSEPRSR